jgi:transcriptional regulator with XRE-family HTH domain
MVKMIGFDFYTRQLMDLIELGERIKAARKAKGWSQTKLAQASGVSRARLEALENARLAEIGFKHLLRILNALDLDLRLTQFNRGRPTLEDLVTEGAG